MSKIRLINDSFQNYKSYGIPKAQLVLTDVPYVLGTNAYASNPSWYVGGITRTGRVTKQDEPFSKQTPNSVPLSSCTSAQRCLSKSPNKQAKPLVW